MRYDALIVGGGIAGLQAAIQLGRYEHKVLVLDKEDGRSSLCRRYNNLLGWPDGISGRQLRERGRQHAGRYGVEFRRDEITSARKTADGGFIVLGHAGRYEGSSLLLATGVTDRLPPLPGLAECLGLSIYICPDCDGYETGRRRTVVIGAGASGAHMALALSYWQGEIILVDHGAPESSIGEALEAELAAEGIRIVRQRVQALDQKDGYLEAVRLADGTVLEARVAFVAMGGAAVHTELARELGVERLENRHAVADPRSKMSNVPGVWIAGDIGVHAEQVTVAMAEGTLSAIWMHKYVVQRLKTPIPAR